MSRRFALVTLVLVATAAFLVGLIVAGSMTPAPADSSTPRPTRAASATRAGAHAAGAGELRRRRRAINPAVVNIDATSRNARDDSSDDSRDGRSGSPWDSDRERPRRRDAARGAGSSSRPTGTSSRTIT